MMSIDEKLLASSILYNMQGDLAYTSLSVVCHPFLEMIIKLVLRLHYIPFLEFIC